MSKNKQRADQLLVQKGLAESRERAKRLIMAGDVFCLDQRKEATRVKKPGQLLPDHVRISLREPERFVSRGGYKLEAALQHFGLCVTDLVALDVGSSTGGFTDCLLQFGAKRVYATDVGTGLLDQKLRLDPRVVVLEGINFRYAPQDMLPEKVGLAVADCSFISLRAILPGVVSFLKPRGRILALIKPQFELQKHQVGKGVVRSTRLQEEAIAHVQDHACRQLNLEPRGSVPSIIRGPKGNQEHFLLLVGKQGKAYGGFL